jgi:formylglycine-generating enzyme required for sulfatase activity
MSDIFISYKREDQPEARRVANALEREGWSVWWDPKLRAGEHFDDVIEKALMESKCVVVLWSKLSVNSRYVKDETSYALNRHKLVPVAIEQVELPFRFEGLHTPSLMDWDGTNGFPEFQKLIEDITAIIGQPGGGTKKSRGSIKRRRAPLQTSTEGISREPGAIFQDTLMDGSSGPEMVVLPAGTFDMGDIHGMGEKRESPVHTVRIRKPFAMGRYQLTFDEYDYYAILTRRESPEDAGWGRGKRPVINACQAI